MFDSLSTRLQDVFKTLRGQGRLTEQNVEAALREIRLALASVGRIERAIKSMGPDSVHIATEGPIGWITRYVCQTRGYPFTTSYHTRFPEYLAERLPVPLRWSYAALRRFHNSGDGIMVGSPTLEQALKAHGFRNLMPWSRGVDAVLFRPRSVQPLAFPGPVFLYVGRIAVEKNLEAFLALDLPGSTGRCVPACRRDFRRSIFWACGPGKRSPMSTRQPMSSSFRA